MRLIEHVVGGERIAENLEVQGAKYAFIFRDFLKVRIDAPLADFVADYGNIVLFNEAAVVRDRLWWIGIEAAAQAGAPLVAPRSWRAVVLVFGNVRPAGSWSLLPARRSKAR